jgi:hypothetical protein
MSRYSKDTTLSARLNDKEVARVDRLRDVGYSRSGYLSSSRRPSRSDVIREALKDAEEELSKKDTVAGKALRKLRG